MIDLVIIKTKYRNKLNLVKTSITEEVISEPITTTTQAARLDGDEQKWVLSSPIAVTPLTEITFKFIADAATILNTYRRFFGSEDFSLSLDTGGSKDKFRFTGCSVKLDDVQISSDSALVPQDGLEHKITIIPNVSVTIEAFGGLNGRSDRNVSAILYDLTITASGTITNQISLTNRGQGATQLAIVGTVNATMANYIEAEVWEEIDEIE